MRTTRHMHRREAVLANGMHMAAMQPPSLRWSGLTKAHPEQLCPQGMPP